MDNKESPLIFSQESPQPIKVTWDDKYKVAHVEYVKVLRRNGEEEEVSKRLDFDRMKRAKKSKDK